MENSGGRVAIVTGASRGIGRAIAERLARNGASVVVNYRSGANEAGEVVSAVESAGGEAVAVQADVSQVEDVRRLFEEIVSRFGRLDILVNNAGVGVGGPVAEISEEEFDRAFTLNARGTFFCLQEAARRITDGGRIVSISSSVTATSGPGMSIYAGGKAAVEQFSRALARELGPRSITVNVVSPGPTDTEFYAGGPGTREEAEAASPLGRIGRSEDIADVVAFLVSEEARWITGQNIQASGGVA